MKKKIIAAAVIVALVLALIGLNFIGMLFFLNEPLNGLFAGMPDKSCAADSDCVLRATSCHPCDCGDAVNKNWHPYCPFVREALLCKICPSLGVNFNIKCVDNLCSIIWSNK